MRRSNRIALVALTAFLLSTRPGLAIDPEKGLGQYTVRAWQAADGLAGDAVRDITQTADGHLWVATDAGVSRYDGAGFSRFDMQTVPEMRSDDVQALLARSDGALWVTSLYAPALVFANGLWKLGLNAGGLTARDRRVRALHEDSRGVLSIVGEVAFLSVDRAGRVTKLRARPPHEAFGRYSLLRDSRGRLWLGTNVGLHVVPKDGAELAAITLPTGSDRPGVGAMCEDRAGRLWVGAREQLLRFDGEQLGYATHPGVGIITAVVQDRHGALWVGGTAGLARYRRAKLDEESDGGIETFGVADGLPDERISALFEDREGSLWVGTRGHGLAQFTDRTLSTAPPDARLLEADVESLCEDAEGGLWFGTANDGAYRWLGGRLERYSTEQGLPSKAVKALRPASDGGVWIGTHRGVALWRRGEVSHLRQRLSVNALHTDRQGVLWIGAADGLRRLEGADLRMLTGTSGVGKALVLAIGEDDKGALWVSTPSHVYRSENGRFEEQPGVGPVRDFLRDADGAMWITTERSGLYRWRGGALAQIAVQMEVDEAGGPHSVRLGQIVDDGRGHFWLGARPGVLRVSKAGLNAFVAGQRPSYDLVAFETTDTRKGVMVSKRQGNALRLRDGRVLFSGDRGVIVVDPTRQSTNTLAPPVVIDRIVINGRPVAPGNAATFAPGPGTLELTFAGLSFLQPRKNRHRYLLAGYDSQWIEAGNRRTALYPKVPPGRYRFHVQASNNDGVWNSAGASFAFELEPYFHQTRWFLALCLAGAGAFIVALFRARARALGRRHAAVLQERVRLAREVHDTLLQGMTAVWAQLDTVSDLLPQSAGDARAKLHGVQDLVAQSLDETRQFVTELRDAPRSQGDLARAFSLLAQRVSSGGATTCTVEVAGDAYRVPEQVQNALFAVGREALANVLKHARARKVVLRLDYGAEALSLTVRDDGQGFAPGSADGPDEGHFGLLGLRERAGQIGATLSIESGPGQGTKVIVVWRR